MRMNLEKYFEPFRKNIIGNDQYFESPFGKQKIVYADWTASGRLYAPIEEALTDKFGPFVGNTHTETSITGCTMTVAYHKSLDMIKSHVNASEDDYIIACESGMTGVINKFQRILGFKIHENFKGQITIPEEERPVVFITHMEHHSNHTSWLETIVTLEIIHECENGLPDLKSLEVLLEKYKNRKTKIASVSACSNVTGVVTPYHEIAKMMHENGGHCFVDFACSAPYVDINMHPENDLETLDAVFFSPHKFLGGPGTPGVMIFNKKFYNNEIPDIPGGGTVTWTNPWGGRHYFDEVEVREAGGTPPFMQTIRAAMSVQLKEEMGVENIIKREEEILELIFDRICGIDNLHILAGDLKHRMGVVSFYIDDLHFNLGVKLLNDRYGIQMRGGCSCAGTYGHILLDIPQNLSNEITQKIDSGDYRMKPGWIRFSIHPTMTNDEIDYITQALIDLAKNHKVWAEDYVYHPDNNEFTHKNGEASIMDHVDSIFASISTLPVKQI
ncbi:aminotransferase class V-fold PLP-dependent enzyme [bacterium SCSIO 12643]|nr:aminotransferase class V-fold PLP-dependent enzyme [bacterium SCSIO 12643]